MDAVRRLLDDLASAYPDAVEDLTPGLDGEVRDVYLMEDLRQTGDPPALALIILSRTASIQAEGYEFDVALRRLNRPAGIVIQSTCRQPSTTAIPMAIRMGVPVLWLRLDVDLGDLYGRVNRWIAQPLPAQIERIGDALAGTQRFNTINLEDIAEWLAGFDPFGFRIGPREPGAVGAPLVTVDDGSLWLQRDSASRFEDILAELFAWRIAAAVTTEHVLSDRADQTARLSTGSLIDQILGAEDEQELRQLTRRARGHGIHIDAWHEAVLLDFSNLLVLSGNDQVLAYARTENLARHAVQSASRLGGTWSMAMRPSGSLLVRTRSRPRSHKDVRNLLEQISRVIEELRSHLPELDVLCGVGSSHEGTSGLRVTYREATSAMQDAGLRKRPNVPILFDAPGVRRLLVEWYSSMTVRESIAELLAPLEALGSGPKRTAYLETLRVYLDTNRSIARTAEQLFIHRNTVSYRLNRVLQLLDIDLDDPHQALSLQLACHAEVGLEPAGAQ